jgi:hypothetical protein
VDWPIGDDGKIEEDGTETKQLRKWGADGRHNIKRPKLLAIAYQKEEKARWAYDRVKKEKEQVCSRRREIEREIARWKEEDALQQQHSNDREAKRNS